LLFNRILLQQTYLKMTKASKARLLAELEKRLAYYDLLIALNMGNDAAIKSFEEEYKKDIATLTAIRDTPTTD
jgi:hypothetical protein